MKRRALWLLAVPAAAQPALQPRPSGGWRITLDGAASTIPTGAQAMLAALAPAMAETPGRVTIIATASAPGLDPSFARRLSLARAQSAEQALLAGGLPPGRIDIRPLGRQEGADHVDVLPPGVAP